MITVQPKFLSETECDVLIQFHKHYFPTLGVEYCPNVNHLINLWELREQFDFVNILHDRLMAHIKTIDEKVTMDYFEICERFVGTSMDLHTDYKHQKYTSIIYLNNDYEGGETIVEGIFIKPEIGNIITFKGSEIPHGINEIKGANRFAIPVWYK